MKSIRDALFNPDFPVGFFLDPSEQEQLTAGLVYYEVIKMDNARNLPLANGGNTDIYINIRESRKQAEAVSFLSDRYAMALKRLGVDCIADVPLAVSNLSGSIQERLGVPAITIREEAKKGRATQGVIIGDMQPGRIVGLYDDVMTDGESKIKPYYAIMQKGGTPYLVIMVDRQQGWKRKFAQLGINMPVWAGTDLHTIRRHLIQTFGLMQRCDPAIEEANPFVVALDGKSWEEVLPLLDEMRPSGPIFKINDLLHDQSRNNIVRDVSVYGRAMIDFKGHDIPTTVYNTCKQYRENPPWAVTVHASGGEEMVRAAVKAFEGTPTKVLAVTVFTSMDSKTCEMIYNKTRIDEVKELAYIGHLAGCHGFVCSGEEVEELSKLYPGKEFLTTGTRSPGADAHDQKNVITHKEALDRGATKLIAGRQFTQAKFSVIEFKRVMREELGITI